MLKKGWQGVKTAKSGVNLAIETFWNVLQPPSSGKYISERLQSIG